MGSRSIQICSNVFRCFCPTHNGFVSASSTTFVHGEEEPLAVSYESVAVTPEGAVGEITADDSNGADFGPSAFCMEQAKASVRQQPHRTRSRHGAFPVSITRGFCLCCIGASAIAAGGGRLSPRAAYAEARGIVSLIKDSATTSPITIHRLRNNVGVLEGSGGNVAVLTGPDGKMLVDAGI